MSRKWYMKIFRRVCNHSILRIYRNLLRKKMNFVREVQILYHSRRQRRELWRGGQHCFDRDNRIFMQIIFFENICFLPFFHLERIIFGGLSSEPRQQGCNHCMLHVHRNILRKNKKMVLSKKVYILYPSRRLQGKYRHRGQHSLHRDNRIFMQVNFLNYMFF